MKKDLLYVSGISKSFPCLLPISRRNNGIKPMKLIARFTLGTGLILLLGPASSRGADDKIADDLEKAKTKFEADTKKLRADIQDDFDRRLTKARDKGDKKLVEKIKDEQKVFDMHGI